MRQFPTSNLPSSSFVMYSLGTVHLLLVGGAWVEIKKKIEFFRSPPTSSELFLDKGSNIFGRTPKFNCLCMVKSG